MFGTYTKAIIMALTVLVIALSAIAGASGLGLSTQTVAWISTIAGIIGTALTVIAPNANQPTVPPGHVVVPAESVKPEAASTVVFTRAA